MSEDIDEMISDVADSIDGKKKKAKKEVKEEETKEDE